MLGETSNISQFWLKCIIFLDETAPFPENVLKSGHYLGLGIDVGYSYDH